MKNLFPLLFLLTIQASAQQAIGLLESTTLRCNMTSTGDLFKSFDDPNLPGFEAPANSGIRPIYVSNFWMGGLDPNQQIRIAAERYEASGQDWFCGPLSNDGLANISVETQDQYNRVWNGNRSDVLAHIEHFDNNLPNPNYAVPQWMMEWPAHGNVAMSQDFYLAPFMDFNQNNMYDPENGDYPSFCGDHCALWIFNDKGSAHGESGGFPIGVQVIATAYTFDHPDHSNRVYFNYKVKNMGSTMLNDSYVGWFTDFDLGNPLDDYLGTYVNLNSVYAYNGDDFDENTSLSGYEGDLAMSAFVLLKGPSRDPDNSDNPLLTNSADALAANGHVYPIGRYGLSDGIIDNESLGLTNSMLAPSVGAGNSLDTPTNYYNRLRGVWSNGAALTYGEDGQSTNNVDSKFMYPGDTDPLHFGTNGTAVEPWSEQSANNAPGDRVAVAASGPFTFAPGQTLNLDFAYIFIRDSEDNEDLNTQMYLELMDTHDHYLSDINTCHTSTETASIAEPAVVNCTIFPNPSSNRMIIQCMKPTRFTAKIFDGQGKLVHTISGYQSAEVPVLDLSNGLYTVAIEFGDDFVRQQIMIQH